MLKRKLVFGLSFYLTFMLLPTDAFCQTTSIDPIKINTQSKTRSTYLEKAINIERHATAFQTKIAWVKNDPIEDSIAIAEGWYDMMNINLGKLNDQLVVHKIEQIQNYYEEILTIPFDNDQAQNKIVTDIIMERKELAPDYPDAEKFIPTSESSISDLETWLKEFPLQYENFTSYLEMLVNSHFQ